MHWSYCSLALSHHIWKNRETIYLPQKSILQIPQAATQSQNGSWIVPHPIKPPDGFHFAPLSMMNAESEQHNGLTLLTCKSSIHIHFVGLVHWTLICKRYGWYWWPGASHVGFIMVHGFWGSMKAISLSPDKWRNKNVVIIISKQLYQNDVTTSFWRNDVIFSLYGMCPLRLIWLTARLFSLIHWQWRYHSFTHSYW